MRYASILIALGFLLTACNRRTDPHKLSSDERLRQKLVGTWYTTNIPNCIFSFNSDRSAIFNITNDTREWTYQLIWRVEDGFVYTTVKDVTVQNTTNYEAIGHTSRFKILYLDDHDLDYWIENTQVQGGGFSVLLNR